MPVGSDFLIDYPTRRIYHNSGATIYAVQEFYSWLMDIFDESGTVDDTLPMSAQTPTSFTLTNGWFIEFNATHPSFQFLKGGAIKTVGWKATTYNPGIRVLTFNSSGYASPAAGDIGKTISYAGGAPTDTGVLLDFDNTARKWWVRVASTSAAYFSNTATQIQFDAANKGTLSTASTTGEYLWTNLYTLGTIENNTDIYIYQNGSPITSWWATGHIDVLIPVKQVDTLIDSGNLTFFARQYSKLYDHAIIDASGGGRTPVPLATASDINNNTGVYAFDFDAGSGTFVVGEIITSGTKKGIITAVTQTNPTGKIYYYLIHPHTQFADNDAITAPSGGACNVNEPAAIENVVAGYTDITLTFGTISRNLNNGQGAKNYDVEIDCNFRPLTEVYQYLKFLTRETSVTSVNGANGEKYVAAQTAYSPIKTAPFGTFAGGKFFGARGVWLKNVYAPDANNYELIEAAGTRQVPPASITIIVNNIVASDQVSVFRSTGSGSTSPNKSMYTLDAAQISGVAYVRVNETITNDIPSTGYIRVVRRDAVGYILGEERYAYTSWNNTGQPSYSTFVVAATTQAYGTTDTAYVGYIDEAAAGTSISKSIIYVADQYLVATLRKAGINPYTTTVTLTAANLTIAPTRTTDSNYTTNPAAGFTLNYVRQTITHTAGTTIYTTNQLYDYCMEQLAAADQMDDAIPMTAQTPTAFTLTNGWFIDPVSLQYINGGSLKTSDWTHPTNTTGVRLLTFGSTYGGPPVAGDIGRAVVGATTGDTGRLLYFDNTAKKWWVRSDASNDLFDVAENITLTGGTAGTRTTSGASVSGENIWANIYTLGTLAANTQIYIYQNCDRITPWWSTGHINVLMLIKEAGTEIDSGNITVLARQYSKLYDHYTTDLSSGNQTPIPLATFNDSNNISGYRTFDGTGGSGNFSVGEILQKVGDPTYQGIITSVSGGSSTPTIKYYLFKYPATNDFANSDSVTGLTSNAACTVGNLADTGPALTTDITTTFGAISRDLNNGFGSQPYLVEIDCKLRPLTQVYEYLKFLTRFGYTTLLNGAEGESYVAADGSYDPVKQSPFGTFAGGKFFGARGVWLKNIPTTDLNNYELVDANNVRQVPPSTIAITVSGVVTGDRVSIFRTTGDNEIIDRAIYTSHATANTSGGGTFTTTTPIDGDTPTSGVLRVVNNTINDEDRYAYDSWTGSTFTLSGGVTLNHTYDTADTAYVPYIDRQATDTTESQAVIYDTDRCVLSVVRIAGQLPFKIKGQVTANGLSVTAIRTADSVYTPG